MADTYSAKLKFARISPTKIRLVVDMIRGKKVSEALTILQENHQRGAAIVDKVLRSAWANAERDDAAAEQSEFRVAKATVDGGPIIYRGRPASMGRYVRIRKRTSHIQIELAQPARKA